MDVLRVLVELRLCSLLVLAGAVESELRQSVPAKPSLSFKRETKRCSEGAGSAADVVRRAMSCDIRQLAVSVGAWWKKPMFS